MTTTVVDPDFITATLVDIVRINSVNPNLAPDGCGEREIAMYLEAALREMGAEVSSVEHGGDRVSVVGRVRGTGSGRSLMLNAHIDTVGVEGMEDPFAGAVRDGRVYGRGAYDMKGSVAACVGALKALAKAPPSGDVLIAAVADEEYGSLGTFEIVRQFPVDGAVVTEPSQLEICRAHKGFVWTEVEVLGRAAHGSQYEQGVDANLRMGRVLTRLAELERSLREDRHHHDLVGPGTLHAAMLEGGTGISTYAASASLKIERRTIPGESEAQVVGELEEILAALSAEDPSFTASLEKLLVRDPFEVAPDAPIVQALEVGARTVLGVVPPHRGENPWMDSAILAGCGVDTVVFGPSGTGAHAAEEWVDLESVVRLSEILVRTANEYCT